MDSLEWLENAPNMRIHREKGPATLTFAAEAASYRRLAAHIVYDWPGIMSEPLAHGEARSRSYFTSLVTHAPGMPHAEQTGP